MSNLGAASPPPVRYADILFVAGVLDPTGQNPKRRRVVNLTPNDALAADFPSSPTRSPARSRPSRIPTRCCCRSAIHRGPGIRPPV